MNLFCLLEICIYELIDLIPNLVLALLPFQNCLRFSKNKISFYMVVLYFLLIFSRVLALKGVTAAASLSSLWILFYLIFYMIVVKSQLAKLLFVLITILNYGSFIVIIFSYIAYHRISWVSNRPYSLSASLILFGVYVITYPFIYKMMMKIQILTSSSENNNYWRFLWMVPATFCLSYYYNLYANGGIILFSQNSNNVLFSVLFNFGALFATYLIMHLLQESNTNLELKSENYQLSMQFIQYENLTERIEDARRAKHDLRQSLAVIQGFVQNNDQKGLLKYLKSYMTALPTDSPLLYCENAAVNALIVYYSDLAKKHNVAFEANIDCPSDITLSDADSVVLLGNLLENALEANIRQTIKKGFVRLHIKKFPRMLIITLDNSYDGMIRKEGEDFISSKNCQKGIGTASIKKIVSKYNGILKFHYENNQFHASVMLHL